MLMLGGLAATSGVAVYLLFRLRGHWQRLEAGHRELEAATLAAQNLAREQRAFLGRSSHELRTPLTSILGYLEEVLETPGAVTGDSADHVRTAYRNAQRMHALVDDLLTLDQVDTRSVGLKVAPITASALLDPVVRDFEGSCTRNGVRLVAPSGEPHRELLVDTRRTQQILENLLSNALMHTDAGGILTIECHEKGNTYVITVADTGCGIAPDEVTKVFDRFYRSRASTRAAIPGTGLGLPIARSLAEIQAGSLTLSSVEGEGTTMTLTLPTAGLVSEAS